MGAPNRQVDKISPIMRRTAWILPSSVDWRNSGVTFRLHRHHPDACPGRPGSVGR